MPTAITKVCLSLQALDVQDDGDVWGDKTVEIDTLILRAMQEAAERQGTKQLSPLAQVGNFELSAEVLRALEPTLKRAESEGQDAALLLCDIVG